MSKRAAEDGSEGHQAYLKRQKITASRPPLVSVEEIRSAKQLRQVLAFDQDVGRARNAISTFKAFLDSFSTGEGENGARIAILTEYLESQKPPKEDDQDAVYLPDLMQAWSFAAQSNDDRFMSGVPAVLALLLRTISSILELSEHGLRLGRTLLLKQHQDLIARSVTANKTKDFVISPALRLLKEMSNFDGGALAKQIFRYRDQTFKGLGRNLSLRYNGKGMEDPKKPSVRTNALRFLLSAIKFLPSESKGELLNQKDIVMALTRDLKDDPPFIVRDILETLRVHVLLDEALPRAAKTKVLGSIHLGRIAALYRYDQLEEETMPPKKTVDEVAHQFLLLACTSPGSGVLLRQPGLYPRSEDPDDTHGLDGDESFIDLGLDSIPWMAKYTEKVEVKNVILSEFIQTLRPWSSLKQSELLQAILTAAPELFADYFYKKKNFSFDPKLTATWMGYAAFVFYALKIPVPKFFGHKDRYARLPPPPAIVLENLLPQPLSRKVMSRCLTDNSSLITFFGIRILCVVLSKLQETLKMYHEAARGSTSSTWSNAADRLIEGFCQRCPTIETVIGAFKKFSTTDLMQREAATNLLVLYYEVVPRVALDSKFGWSKPLSENLGAMEQEDISPEDRVLLTIELEHLFALAHFSPGMRWFSKEGLPISPFMAMLKLSAEAPSDLPLLKLYSVLSSVIQENQILQTTTSISALDTLILGLREVKAGRNSPAIHKFLDDCVSRCTANPVKYIFALEELCSECKGEKAPVSLLSLAIVEQWPFLIKSPEEVYTAADKRAIAQYVACYLAASTRIGEGKNTVKLLTEKLAAGTPEGSSERKSLERYLKLVDRVPVAEARVEVPEPKESLTCDGSSETEKEKILSAMTQDSGLPAEDHGALMRWTTKDIEEVIDDGHAAALIKLLSSKHLGVRKEAATNIAKVAAKMKESSFDEKYQIWLLLCEVVETAKQVIDREPLATIIVVFAANAITVLNDPLHCLYAKINSFLSKGPTWSSDKIPLMHKILDEKPTIDDAHFSEVMWLLRCMLSGLRTEADMTIYRKRLVFEKLLALYNSNHSASGLREKILMLFYRATEIEGGSTTLITRFSTMSWLQAQEALSQGIQLKVLMERIIGSCDKKRISKWSRGAKAINL